VEKNKRSHLLPSVESFIKEFRLFDPGARILIGVSGGPDSMALLGLLTELRPKWGLELMVLYCHHGLRTAADEEEAFVRSWSEAFNCPFFSRRLPVREHKIRYKRSLQEAARELRYQAFQDQLQEQKADLLALAHTADDQAEECLISLIRGAGLGGLAGMPVKRGPFIRPLLRTFRREILDYLTLKDIPFKEDRSNRDFRYLRARVRHHLLPELKKYSPGISAQLNQTVGLLQKDEEYLREQADLAADKVISFSGRTARLKRPLLAALPQALSSRLIQKALIDSLGDLRHIRGVHILSLLKAARGTPIRGRIILPGGWEARWDREEIKILPSIADPLLVPPFSYEISNPGDVFIRETGETIRFREISCPVPLDSYPKEKNRAWVDGDKLTWPLVIRNLRPGDRFRPLGLGGSKKVSRYLMDRKVPRALRAGLPLVLSRGEIVWIAGMDLGQSFCLGSHSRRVLELEHRKTGVPLK
jgi:tRNA(Ile)-lysidine synthase